MSYIWELNISDLDGSEFFFPIKSEKEYYKKNVIQFISKGIPMATSWNTPLILKKEEKYVYDFFI